jgi:hypothetical protein
VWTILSLCVLDILLQPVHFAGLLWLKVLFAGLLWEKNTAGWLLIWLNSSNEQGIGLRLLARPAELFSYFACLQN